MILREVLNEATKRLREKEIESARLDAEVLLGSVLKVDRSFLYTHPEYELSPEQIREFFTLIDRREAHEPVAYILGEKEFMGLPFKVQDGILIPRADTEVQVEKALEVVGTYKDPQVLDLCTGSGAIGLSIKHYHPEATVTLSDISPKAVEIATENSQNLGLDVDIIESDLFEKIDQRYDLIISNPPYIKRETISELEADIKDWEPVLALDGGKSGYVFYEQIIAECALYLKPGGCLIFEIGESQAKQIEQLMRDSGFKKIQILKDLAGLDRGIIGFWI